MFPSSNKDTYGRRNVCSSCRDQGRLWGDGYRRASVPGHAACRCAPCRLGEEMEGRMGVRELVGEDTGVARWEGTGSAASALFSFPRRSRT